MLEVRGLCASYGRIPILTGVTFDVRAGEVVGILGHNGMGKTTLMKALMGMVPPTAGAILFQGAEITYAPTYQRARSGLGYVPQGRQIFPRLSVRDNLRMGAARADDPQAVIATVLEDFPVLHRLLDRAGGALSGGEQQILAIARALCAKPKLMLLDEPTEGIQPSIIESIGESLARLQARSGLTIVLVEQHLEFIAQLSSRVLVIQKGTIVQQLEPDQLHDAAVVDEVAGFGRLQQNQR
jgi:branched-chain amino acid transport system ATP-binding protein